MKPVSIVLLAATLAVGGTWAKEGTIKPSMVIGTGFLSLAIVVMNAQTPKLAEQFSWLLLAATVGAYGEDVFTTVGKLTTGQSGTGTNERQAEKKN